MRPASMETARWTLLGADPPVEELEGGEVLGEFLQLEAQVLVAGAQGVDVAVVHADLAEVASDDVAGLLVERQADGVTPALLGGRDLAALADLPLVEVHVPALHLNERAGAGDEDVDVARVGRAGVGVHGNFELQALDGVFDSQHVLKQVDPVGAALLRLVAPARPALGERLGICLRPCHGHLRRTDLPQF